MFILLKMDIYSIEILQIFQILLRDDSIRYKFASNWFQHELQNVQTELKDTYYLKFQEVSFSGQIEIIDQSVEVVKFRTWEFCFSVYKDFDECVSN